VNLTSQLPPPSNTVGTLRDSPNNRPPQPPIAALDPSSSTDPPHASKRRKGTYEAAQQLATGVYENVTSLRPAPKEEDKASRPFLFAAPATRASHALLLISCLPSYRRNVIQNPDPLICAHGKQYGFDRTFFRPITETRWEKRKLDEEEGAVSSSPAQKTPSSSHP